MILDLAHKPLSNEIPFSFLNRSKGLSPEYNFAPKDGTGLAAIMPAVSPECLDLLQNLLTYDPDYRCSNPVYFFASF
jgi:hypothetical protein